MLRVDSLKSYTRTMKQSFLQITIWFCFRNFWLNGRHLGTSTLIWFCGNFSFRDFLIFCSDWKCSYNYHYQGVPNYCWRTQLLFAIWKKLLIRFTSCKDLSLCTKSILFFIGIVLFWPNRRFPHFEQWGCLLPLVVLWFSGCGFTAVWSSSSER